MMKSSGITVVSTIAWIWTSVATAEVPRIEALSQMPVKEVTVFKDGHAFVQHQGSMPTDPAGNVLMDYLPAPVLGTFWPYTTESDATLTAVTAGQRRVTIPRSPLTIRDLIEAHPGVDVLVTEAPAGIDTTAPNYWAKILGITERSIEEMESTARPNSGDMLPQKGDVVLLQTSDGVKAVSLSRILDVTFREPPNNEFQDVEFRNMLTLQLDWSSAEPAPSAEVGLMYLQRGIRWIPHYKVTIDGKGSAHVQLQATLLNELTDLENVTCHLAIGVPTFQFKNTLDPMALQESLAQLSQFFRESNPRGGQHAMLSNTLMTQAPRMEDPQPQAAPANLGPEMYGSENIEDLHIFTVRNLSLKKGHRMVLPVAAFTVPYRDVYVLDLPFTPPQEVSRDFNVQQQAELARLLSSPTVMHKLRITNTSEHPFTTAPALIVREDRAIGQGLLTYTSRGASTDLSITYAVDIRVEKSDRETTRTQNALNIGGSGYARVDLDGTVTLTNYRDESVQLEVIRYVLGNVTEVSHDGTIAMVNIFEDSSYTRSDGGLIPHWFGWWNRPTWWSRLNGVSRIEWTVELDAGESFELGYAWNYYWR